MKFTGSTLKCAAAPSQKTKSIPRLAGRLVICGLLAGCRPSPEAAPAPTPAPPPKAAAPAAVPTSVVSIPEEFLSPTPAPAPKPSVQPRVVFATSDFQVTTQHGIQGIRAGEAVDFLREDGGEYVVRFRGLEFRKSRSYFSETRVERATQATAPAAGETATGAGRASSDPSLSGGQRAGGLIPGEDPAQLAGQKKVGELTDSIRALNDQIRSAQTELDRASSQPTGGENPAETAKAARSIQRLKEKRDELSGQLSEIGKP